MKIVRTATLAVKIAVLLAIAAVAVSLLYWFDISSLSPMAIKGFVLSFGAYAPVVFVVLFTVRSVFVVVPVTVFTLTGGIAFGPVEGTVLSLVSMFFSAALVFPVSRALGRDLVMKIFGSRLSRIDGMVERNGFLLIFYLRFFTPFDPLSYVAGISRVRYRDFLLATMLPAIPSTAAYTYFGHSLTRVHSVMDLLKPEFVVVFLVLMLVLAVPVVIKLRRDRMDRQIAVSGENQG